MGIRSVRHVIDIDIIYITGFLFYCDWNVDLVEGFLYVEKYWGGLYVIVIVFAELVCV